MDRRKEEGKKKEERTRWKDIYRERMIRKMIVRKGKTVDVEVV